jgi:hypothetical protein
VESFENGFGNWIPDHYIFCEDSFPPSCNCNDDVPSSCGLYWNIESSNQMAYDGTYSLMGYLDGRNDTGTIWFERPLIVVPNSVVDLEISFYIWSEAQSVTSWPVKAYIGSYDPEHELDFTIIGDTDTADGKWVEYFYRNKVTADSSGRIWVAFGFGATWESIRTYLLDFVQVQIQPL